MQNILFKKTNETKNKTKNKKKNKKKKNKTKNKNKVVPEVEAVGALAAPPADARSGPSPDDPAAKEKHLVKEFGDWVPKQSGKSKVWTHFKIRQLNYNKAKYNLCDRELKLSDKGTTTMKNFIIFILMELE